MSSSMLDAQLSINPATTADCGLVAELAKAIWYKHYPEIISLDQIAYMLELMYSQAALTQQMAEGQQFQLLSYANVTVGFLAYTETGPGEYFLNKYYIDNDQHRKGFGSQFFHRLLAQLQQPMSIRLHVNRLNYKSINFYFKNGFVIERVADFDIGQGFQMNDFVMLRESSYRNQIG